ncbi:MAG: ECF-type sigma factor [Planctomycetaceae bacterium]
MSSDTPAPLPTHSVTRMIERLKADDSGAAREIWERFFERLLPLARARLRSLPDRVVDEEDILVSVFDLFFRAARDGRFARLNDRDDLWQILLMLTDRKVADVYRRNRTLKRGGTLIGREEADLHELADPALSPEFLTAFNDHLLRALQRLDDEVIRAVALLKLQCYSNQEIAEQLKMGLSSVERKLRVIRLKWDQEFGN